MTKITIEQFGLQWCPGGNPLNILSRLERNIFDFRTMAGEISRDHFKSSFVKKEFAGTGQKWAPRRSAWARKHRHPLMYDEGRLKDLIKGERDKNNYGGIKKKGLTEFTKTYAISTNEYTTAVKKKRGASGTYAAVHNDAAQTRPGQPQRQFMGHNQTLDMKIAALVPDIFRNIPDIIL